MRTKRGRRPKHSGRALIHGLIIVIAAVAAFYASLSPARTASRAESDPPTPAGAADVLSVQVERRVPVASAGLGALAPFQPLTEEVVALVDAPEAPDRLQALQTAPSPEASPASPPVPTSTPSATSTPVGPACVRDAGHPLYCIYTVKPGDTLSRIAREFNLVGSSEVSPGDLLTQSNKPDVVNSDQISPGLKLRVPLESGIIHTVFSAETLAQIAQQYGVRSDDIQALASNKISDLDHLMIGQELIVPAPTRLPAITASPPATSARAGPEPAAEQPAAEPSATATSTSSATATATPAASMTPSRRSASPTATVAAATRSRTGFIWPAAGPISSYFGPAHPLGIDIDFFANQSAPVVAAAAGTVTFAGGNQCCSYGYYVIIDHGNGFVTLYAHLSKISVSAGQKLTQGQLLGYGGHTGYATGNHLHFEMRYDGSVVNPLTYLP